MTLTKEKNQYYAHSVEGKDCSEWELLAEHLNNVARRTGQFCKQFGFEQEGKIAGLMHDGGKYLADYQNRIRGKNIDVDHAICGAQEILTLLKTANRPLVEQLNAEMLAYVIAGHHSGLPNLINPLDQTHTQSVLAVRLNKQSGDFSAYKNEISFSSPTRNWTENFKDYAQEDRMFAFSFLVRMLYSALVDADSLETEKFYTKKDRNYNCSGFEVLQERLNAKLTFFQDLPQSPLNKRRNQILQACLNKAEGEKGVYSLTVPTGGGKTLASMAFALRHLLKNGHRRIIYCIPFLSIAQQTTQIFKDIFGEQNVLEHNSNATFEDSQKQDTPSFFACENWEQYPIIITTNVQFFESLFSNKRGSCRKLHNVANSVVVFDEAQTLPVPLLKPCLKAVDILTRNFGCSALLMSATCPNFAPFMCNGANITELNDNYKQHYLDFKRVQATYIGYQTDQEIIQMIDKNSQTLVVVNSRKHAKKMFEALPDSINKYHLSTLMTAPHRKQVLNSIRTDLKANIPCVVVSTSLIEAGVDLDFETVFRSLAGIDSLVQAGGRCNREGKRVGSVVYIFESENDPSISEMAEYKSLARPLCQKPVAGDIFSLENINCYFESLFNYKDATLDSKNILKMFRAGRNPFFFNFDFASCNEAFRYIDSPNKYDIVIPQSYKAHQLIQQLTDNKNNFTDRRQIVREISQFVVSVYKHEFFELNSHRLLQRVEGSENMFILVDMDNYHPQLGLNLVDLIDQTKKIFVV